MPALVNKYKNHGTSNRLKQLQIAVSIIENHRSLSALSDSYFPLLSMYYTHSATYHKLLLMTNAYTSSEYEDWPVVYFNWKIGVSHRSNMDSVISYLAKKHVTLIIDLFPIGV